MSTIYQEKEVGTPSDPLEVEPQFLLQGDLRVGRGCRLTMCRGPNRKCSSSGEEGLAMLPRSRACRVERAWHKCTEASGSPLMPWVGRVLTNRLKVYLIF